MCHTNTQAAGWAWPPPLLWACVSQYNSPKRLKVSCQMENLVRAGLAHGCKRVQGLKDRQPAVAARRSAGCLTHAATRRVITASAGSSQILPRSPVGWAAWTSAFSALPAQRRLASSLLVLVIREARDVEQLDVKHHRAGGGHPGAASSCSRRAGRGANGLEGSFDIILTNTTGLEGATRGRPAASARVGEHRLGD